MILDGATSTSDCIGGPRTPRCALDALHAGRFHADIEMCPIARSYPKENAATFTLGDRPDPGWRIEYRVLKIHRVSAADARGGVEEIIEPGDIESLTADRTCAPLRSACDSDKRVRGYFVRLRHERAVGESSAMSTAVTTRAAGTIFSAGVKVRPAKRAQDWSRIERWSRPWSRAPPR